MKAFKKTAFLAIALSAAVAGLAGCKSNVKMPVTFVAVTSDTYNAEVTLGEINYKFQGKFVQNSNKFVLDAIAQGKKSSGGQGGGPGGFGGGFPGGGPGGNSSGPEFVGFGAGDESGEGEPGGFPGFPGEGGENPGGENPGFPGEGGEQPGQGGEGQSGEGGENPGGQPGEGGENPGFPGEGGEQPGGNEGGENPGGDEQGGFPGGGDQGGFPGGGDQQGETSEQPEEDNTDYSQFNFAINATYVEEKGYGYAITFADEGNTTIHTDFDKIEGRHSFYYNVKHGDDSAVVHFQAKDPTFKNQLASDYKKWDERDSEYIFYAKATGNNNSVATAYMYLHKTNHDVVVNTPNGANRSLSFGMTWEENSETIIIHNGDETITADKTLPDAEHRGYRLVYNSNTYYCSLNPDVKWKKLTIADFEGKNAYEFVGEYTTTGPDGGTKAVNLNLIETGNVAKLYLGTQTASFVGSWAKDGDKLSVTFEGQTGEFEFNEGKYSIIIRVSVSSFFGSQEVAIVLTQAK